MWKQPNGSFMRVIRAYVICVLMVGAARAQTSTATVVGRITDATGGVVPGVAVRVTNLATNIVHRGSSNEVGDYTVPYLQPGNYSLEASASGFQTYRHSEFELEVAQSLRIDIKLEIGAATESVTVTDSPAALNTESGTRGDVTTNLEIAE